MGDLKHRVAIVTGGGRGIGAAVARRLAAEGAAVVVNDLGAAVDGSGKDEGPAASVCAEIVAAGGEAVPNDSDISDFDQAGQLITDTVNDLGRLDILVNTAGILRDRMIFNMSEEEWDAVIRVHLKGTFNTSRHATAHWRDQRNPGGNFRLINFASTSGLFGMPSQPNYGAAKMGIVGLTYNIANTLERHGVTANAIAPSADTRMTETVIAAARRTVPRRPEDVATVVAYLATPAASWCNGRVIGVGGTEVTLYSDPQAIRQVMSAQPWDLETLGAALEQSFAPVPRGSAGRWDKVRTALSSETATTPTSAAG